MNSPPPPPPPHTHTCGVRVQTIRTKLTILAVSVDHLVKVELLVCTQQDPLLDRFFGEKTVDVHCLGLPNAMYTGHSLDIHLRVPVRVVQDAGVCSLEIDPQAASTGVEDVDENVRAGAVEKGNVDPALDAVRGAVHAPVLVASHVQVVLNDVKHNVELGEQDNPVPVCLELREKLVEHLTGTGQMNCQTSVGR